MYMHQYLIKDMPIPLIMIEYTWYIPYGEKIGLKFAYAIDLSLVIIRRITLYLLRVGGGGLDC